jgi:hypothetical protein
MDLERRTATVSGKQLSLVQRGTEPEVLSGR